VDATFLGIRIRQARERMRISQEELAAKVQRDQRAISEYENGKRKLPATDLPIFAHALNVPLMYFFSGETAVSTYQQELLQNFELLSTDEEKRAAISIIKIFADTLNSRFD
jgi:transcriptional regulator with XRE-family HTH domain